RVDLLRDIHRHCRSDHDRCHRVRHGPGHSVARSSTDALAGYALTRPRRTMAIRIENLYKLFNGGAGRGGVTALAGASLDVQDGEFVTLVGQSGCGKTTLLNIVGGLEHPTSGEVSVDGKPVSDPGPDRGVIFQQYALFPWLTVQSNI